MPHHFDEIFKAVTGAGVAMGLEGEYQAPTRKSTPCGSQGCGHLDRVMAVVFYQGEMTAVISCQVTIALEPAAHAFELSQCFLHSYIRHIELNRDCNG